MEAEPAVMNICLAVQAKIAASPLLTAASKMASAETRKVLRRLHVTGAQEKHEKRRESAPFARLLGKASHANPLAVCSVLVGQVLSASTCALCQPLLTSQHSRCPHGQHPCSLTLWSKSSSSKACSDVAQLRVHSWVGSVWQVLTTDARLAIYMLSEGVPVPCQVEAYSVMSEPIVDALYYFSALSFDVLSFLIIERLAASGRPKLKDDGINISDWLQVHPACLFF